MHLNVYNEVKELSSPGPLHTGPKAHAEEEETPEDKQRESQLSRDIAKDNPRCETLSSGFVRGMVLLLGPPALGYKGSLG